MNTNTVINEIVTRISARYSVDSIILFGSNADNSATDDSDIDILVILDEPGIVESFSRLVERRNNITRLLIDLRKIIAIDVLVYTRDEWTLLVDDGSSFVKNILEYGRKIA